MIKKFNYYEIERIVYIWGRYSGTRDETKEGKHYSKSDIDELIRRLNKFKENPSSFDNGFEKDNYTQEDEKANPYALKSTSNKRDGSPSEVSK